MTAAVTPLPPQASSVPAARYFLRAALTGVQAEIVDAAELLTAELVSNAVHHAGTPLTLSVTNVADGAILVEVTDGSGDLPHRKADFPDRPDGHGLTLLDGLAAEWGITVNPGEGKAVWCLIRSREPTGARRPLARATTSRVVSHACPTLTASQGPEGYQAGSP